MQPDEIAEKFPRHKKAQDNRRQQVETILEMMLAEDALPWTKPWSSADFLALAPRNAVTGAEYKGGNAFWLGMIAMSFGYADGRWMTFNQGKKAGYSLKKGSKSAAITYFSRREKKDGEGNLIFNENGRPESFGFWTQHNVFHVSDFIDFPEYEPSQTEAIEPHSVVQSMVETSGASVTTRLSTSAHYVPSHDQITLPKVSQFHNQAGWVETVLHEMAHWTGHPSRLGRKFGTRGTKEYAAEELVAEMATFFVAQSLRLPFEPSGAASYLKSWSKGDEDLVRQAISGASAAADFLLAFAPESEEVPDSRSSLAAQA